MMLVRSMRERERLFSEQRLSPELWPVEQKSLPVRKLVEQRSLPVRKLVEER